MCGIFAILSIDQNKVDLDVFERMSRSLIHRGPDDCGYAFFELFNKQKVFETKNIYEGARIYKYNGVLAFGHRRLSIIDLSEAGHQPMCNEKGNIWIILNGEIYNYKELTEELKRKGHYFLSRTDTEVILHAYEEWGIECLNHFNGMWAFALWDRDRKRLFCARDRFGIKPFYYFFDGKKFMLASEIKAILQDPKIERSANHNRVYDYLAYGFLDHTDETFFQSIKQLRGSHYLTLDIKGQEFILDIQRYWDLNVTDTQRDYPFSKRFLELLEDSIKLHMRSDVPIGTCLSGGLDSSSIVCIAQKYLNSNIHKTFSSCFEDERYDERKYIQEITKATHTEPYYIFPDPDKLFDELHDLIWYQEEPFGSTSIYAQWNVFKLAKEQGVKVILDGQGADEILAGYHPYFGYYLGQLLRDLDFKRYYHEYQKIRLLHKYSDQWLIRQILLSMIPTKWYSKIRKQAILNRLKWLNKHNYNYEGVSFPQTNKNIFYDRIYHSLMNFSLPGLLHYEDRNSMAHSIEARVPFLDYRLIEYAFSLPIEQFIQDGSTKVILREAMIGILPETIRNRVDKMGFVTPENIWFKNSLKKNVLEIIHSKSFAERGYINIEKAKEAFKNHCDGKINISTTIWRWVNLELWLKTIIDNMPKLR